jgi:hypothetical protein
MRLVQRVDMHILLTQESLPLVTQTGRDNTSSVGSR